MIGTTWVERKTNEAWMDEFNTRGTMTNVIIKIKIKLID